MILRRFKQALGRFIIPKLPISRYAFDIFRLEINALIVRMENQLNPWRLNKIYALRKTSDLSVNIGCGPFGKEGWVNLDLMKGKNVSLRFDCRRRLPFRDDSVARIRCEHFFEHLDHYQEAPFFLKSCYRSLKRHGVMRIVVPDAELFLSAYSAASRDAWKSLGWNLNHLPEGFQSEMDILNHIFHQGGEHRHAYDFKSLEIMLRSTGFKTVQKVEFAVSSDPELRHDLPNHKNHSLYVEAIK